MTTKQAPPTPLSWHGVEIPDCCVYRRRPTARNLHLRLAEPHRHQWEFLLTVFRTPKRMQAFLWCEPWRSCDPRQIDLTASRDELVSRLHPYARVGYLSGRSVDFQGFKHEHGIPALRAMLANVQKHFDAKTACEDCAHSTIGRRCGE